jgi:hypothetical protein
MELREALSHIAEIRARAAVAERFRGYRAVPIATTGVLAVAAAVVQPVLVPDPAADLPGYLTLWLTTAVIAASAAGSGLVMRLHYATDPVGRELTRLAVGQFAPCLAAGALVTVALARHAPEMGRLLPGLWQVLFSLGVFASCQLLPRPIAAVGVFYLVAGAYNLSLTAGPGAFSPWAMGLPFAVGQLATAGVLYWHLERDHADRPR